MTIVLIVGLVLALFLGWYMMFRRPSLKHNKKTAAAPHTATTPAATVACPNMFEKSDRNAKTCTGREENSDTGGNSQAPIEADRRKADRWRDWLALSTTVIAIMAAIMTLEVSRFSTLAVLYQGKETNTWSYYQAKSVKEHTYQISKAALELQKKGLSGMSPEAQESFSKTIKSYDDEIKRYKDEKDEIKEQAEGLGKKRDKYHTLSVGLNNSLIFLQISIVLSSLASLTRKKYLWYTGLCSLIGWIYFLAVSF